MTAKTAGRDVTAEIAFLTRSLKAPTLREAVPRLADRARAESWTHEEFLAACLQREVSARESHGGEGRIRAARFPARKALEDFDYDHQRSLKRETIAHLGTLDFVTARDNVVFLGRPAPARPTWRPGWPSAPARPGTACYSPPPRNGSPGSPRLTTPAGSGPSSPGSAATRCSSSTYAGTATMPMCPLCGLVVQGGGLAVARHSYRLSRNASILSVGR